VFDCGYTTVSLVVCGNIYDVVIPWCREVSYQEMGIGKPYPRQDRVSNKGDMGCHTKGQTDIQILGKPARLCTE
jgi:hypothetical protein